MQYIENTEPHQASRTPKMIPISRLLNEPSHTSNTRTLPSNTTTTPWACGTTTDTVTTVPPPDIIDIYARWTRYDGTYPKSPEDFIRKTHVYSVTIPPSTPLAVGKRVRVFAISPAHWCSPGAEADLFGAYDAHIIGRIRRVLGWKKHLPVIALEVENECRVSAVRKARLEIPYVPGLTVAPLENLREGKGPKEAVLEDLNLDARVQPPLQLWACMAGECVLRSISIPGDVMYDEFWLSGSIYADERKRTRKAKPHERVRLDNMAAVGWKREEYGEH
ncbi:hypothetical protein L226DRAFT_41508 [Lentinus tigrinus ALCF2SS1-7]|uniref:Uncharacterized protein n=1 Tax=Lentinus tigrinus ALCF2SS1-6 TaxID=1328759 RepID=A0A5C2SL52_9APHY|nr:hypothetical protein L227DRAFT_260856 [Lentinus tigrinus ALCF2SS1-6]RPD82913.1 hypothetical protein L226DRAFT_41508 [Lentinus tigrinus ALCF2SS1-7]